MKKTLAVLVVGYVCVMMCVSGDALAKKRKNNPPPVSSDPNQGVPACLDKDRREIIGHNNFDVLKWKVQTKNQYQDRALIVGKFVKVFLDRRSHLQIEVDLGTDPSDSSDHIEIIYNKSFGVIPEIPAGATISACGDYITANAPAGPYPASPVGAIIHWVHASNNHAKHAHGFVLVNGQHYGNSGDAKR